MYFVTITSQYVFQIKTNINMGLSFSFIMGLQSLYYLIGLYSIEDEDTFSGQFGIYAESILE